MKLDGRSAIVTGAAGGIGLATARRLLRDGASVLLADLNQDKLEAAAAQLASEAKADPKRIATVVCDVSREDQVVAAADEAIARFGHWDIVVNNAGLMMFKPIEEQTVEDWQRILGVDLLGAFLFIKQAFLKMKGGGAVVNVSSVHAVETEPLVAPYAAAKTALLSLTRSAALEGKPKGVRVNAVLPVRSTRRCCGITRTCAPAPKSSTRPKSAPPTTSPPPSPSCAARMPPSSGAPGCAWMAGAWCGFDLPATTSLAHRFIAPILHRTAPAGADLLGVQA